MNYSTTWTLNLSDKMTAPLNIINEKGEKMATVMGNSLQKVSNKLEEAAKKATSFGDALKKIKPIDWQAVGGAVDKISERLNSVADVGAKYDAGLRDVSAITGITGAELDKLGEKARGLSKDFGEGATENLETFKTILSRLGPQMGQSQQALGDMGKYANILSKTMEGDVVGATDALTTSMLQFKVNLNDPIAASREMERMMNAMAAGAKEGASEVPQISAALTQAGGTAKMANLTFEETNSALQALAQNGKYGAEAGVGLRNVLIKMNAPSALSKDAIAALESYGVNMKKVSDTAVPFAERLKELQKIGKSTDALAAVFGAENIQAAQGLIQSAQYQADLTQKITGTNTAYEQAQTVMGGWTEKMKRAKAWVDDLKIGSFQFTSVLSAGFDALSTTASLITDVTTVYSGLAPVMKSGITWLKGTSLWQGITTVTTKVYAASQATLTAAVSRVSTVVKAGITWLKGTALWQGIATVSTNIYTGAQWLLNAALTANPIGIIVVAIAALIAVVVVAIKKYDQWGAALLAFMGPVGIVINAFKSIYDHWESIKKAFQTEGIIGGLKRLGWVLLDAVMKPFQQILEIVDKVTGTNWAATIQKVRASQNLVTEGEKKIEPTDSTAPKSKDSIEKALKDGRLVLYNGKPVLPSTRDREEKKKKEITVSASTFLSKDKDKGSKEKKIGKTKTSIDREGMPMSGEKGNRTINTTITMNNYFSVTKGAGNLDNIANQLAGKFNDRLRDGLVALD